VSLAVYPQLVSKRNAQYADEQGNITVAEGTVNCAAAGGAGLANAAVSQPVLVTHHAFRLAAGNPMIGGRPGGLSMQAVTAALQGYGADATLYRGQDTDIARQALIDGAMLGMAIDYQTLNDNFPELSGQLTFQGGHFCVVYGWHRGRPRNTTSYDSLFDGRTRTWGTAPEGPQRAPFRAYRQAMSAYLVGGSPYANGTPIGAGLGIFIVVR